MIDTYVTYMSASRSIRYCSCLLYAPRGSEREEDVTTITQNISQGSQLVKDDYSAHECYSRNQEVTSF